MNLSPITSSLAAGMTEGQWIVFGCLAVVFVALVVDTFGDKS